MEIEAPSAEQGQVEVDPVTSTTDEMPAIEPVTPAMEEPPATRPTSPNYGAHDEGDPTDTLGGEET